MTYALDAAREALRGEEAWLVGGAVRDRMLGCEVFDIDIVLSGDARKAANKVAAAAGGPAFELSGEFGAWRVVARDHSWQVDLMALQGDTIEEDLSRRDFTINAMAEPLAGGSVLDPYNGEADIAARVLRVVSAQAFDDDPLRVLRLVRFACELDLEPEQGTIIQARARAAGTAGVAAERIFAELRRIVAADAVVAGLRLMDDLGLLSVLLPELGALHGVEQNRYHHLDVFDHTIDVLDQAIGMELAPALAVGEPLAQRVSEVLKKPFSDDITRGTALRFGALLHDIAKPQTQAHHDDGSVLGFPGHAGEGAEVAHAVLTRLKSSDRLRAHVSAMARHHLAAGYLVKDAPLDARLIHRYLIQTGAVAVDVTLLSIADRLATRGRKADEAIPKHLEVARTLLAAALEYEARGPASPAIKGDDLAHELGIEAGPEIGRLLAEIAEAQYAGEVTTARDAVAYARSILES